MSYLDLLAQPGMIPFSGAFAFVLALLLLEMVMALMGMSTLGETGDGPDLDADVDFDVDTDLDFDADLGDADFDIPLEGADAGDAPAIAPAEGLAGWLGLGAVPLTVWLAAILCVFAATGFTAQFALSKTIGALLPALPAAALAAVPGIILGGRLSRAIGRMIPKSESTAISTRSYGRRRGVITVGIATADKPAQARFTDGHGNMHYAMVTPLDPQDAFPQGTEVMILRTRKGDLKAVAIS